MILHRIEYLYSASVKSNIKNSSNQSNIKNKMNITSIAEYKSIPAGINFTIPNLCVLTGKNGSGKSHLLEAIAGKTAVKVFKNGSEINNIHYVGFNELNPQIDEQCDYSQILNTINGVWGSINNFITNYKQEIKKGASFDSVTQYLIANHGENPRLYSTIERFIIQSGKSFDQLTQDDVSQNISFTDLTHNQIFFTQCAFIFKTYHTLKVKNDFNKYRSSIDRENNYPFISDEEFFRRYGPPPWDLINDILSRAGLPYVVSNPTLGDYELPYVLKLVDVNKNLEISANDLSTGEKVLMSLALAIYNTQEGGYKPDLLLPDLLLLDEPDAPLHPQFSKLLIDIIVETIIKKAGVSVIITTHSPSTVAMAPDGAIFEIEKENKTPRVISKSIAIDILTEGVSYLKISYESRRQVFVESRYDVEYFQILYNLLNRKYNFHYQPIFLEPHSGTSNCQDVISIVEKLRSSGNDLAYGIIDFDNKNIETETICILGGGLRYAIENYILDPLYVSLALIRYSKKSFADFGLSGKHSYTDAFDLTQIECQTIVDNFMTHIGITLEDTRKIILENGFEIIYPNSFLLHQGHNFEDILKNKFTELNAISKGKGDSALKLGILQVIEEFPHFLPCELANSFEKVLGQKK